MRSSSGAKGGGAGPGAKGSGGVGGASVAEAYGFMASAAGGPDEFSGNSRMIKAAITAGGSRRARAHLHAHAANAT